jgi:hypothetical protein
MRVPCWFTAVRPLKFFSENFASPPTRRLPKVHRNFNRGTTHRAQLRCEHAVAATRFGKQRRGRHQSYHALLALDNTEVRL